MQHIKVPWQRWIDEAEQDLAFPESWQVSLAVPRDAADIGDAGIARAFAAPMGAPPLAELAYGHQKAAIAVDDITRPTPTYRVLPVMLDELEKGGIPRSRVRIIVASGAHRSPTRAEMARKLGADTLNTMDVLFHAPTDNLVDVGTSGQGTPVRINRYFCEADLRLAIGSVLPHAPAGFGGGRKLVSVGLASLDTLKVFHSPNRDLPFVPTACLEGNPQHQDLEEMTRMVGLHFAAEVVPTVRGGIAALFAGEPSACFLAGVERAWEVYATDMPSDADVVVLNAYPKDYDLMQAINAFNVTLFPNMEIVRPGGTIVLTGACPEGEGLHYVFSHGMLRSMWFEEERFAGCRVLLYSPNLSDFEAHRHFPASVTVCRRWEDVLAELGSRHGPGSRVTVYPCATLQLNPANRERAAQRQSMPRRPGQGVTQ